MEINIINMDRSTDRLAEFVAVNKHLDQISRFSAVNGSTLDRKILKESGVIQGDLPIFTNGAIGSAMSHMLLWKEAVRKGAPITIAEDDAIFNADFKVKSKLILDSLVPDWDIILWGWNFDSVLMFDMLPGVCPCVATFDEKALREHAVEYQRLDIRPQAYRLYRAFGIMAYAVSAAGAKKLLDFCIPLRDLSIYYPGLNRNLVSYTIDCMMNGIYPQINAFVSFPPLAMSKNDKAQSLNLDPTQNGKVAVG
jgi:glycosyl transferase, family 25